MDKKFEMHEIMPEKLKERYKEVGQYNEYGFGKTFERFRFGSDTGDEWGATFELDQEGNLHGSVGIFLDNMNLRQEDIQALQVDLHNKMTEWIRNIKNRNVI